MLCLFFYADNVFYSSLLLLLSLLLSIPMNHRQPDVLWYKWKEKKISCRHAEACNIDSASPVQSNSIQSNRRNSSLVVGHVMCIFSSCQMVFRSTKWQYSNDFVLFFHFEFRMQKYFRNIHFSQIGEYVFSFPAIFLSEWWKWQIFFCLCSKFEFVHSVRSRNRRYC